MLHREVRCLMHQGGPQSYEMIIGGPRPWKIFRHYFEMRMCDYSRLRLPELHAEDQEAKSQG